MTQKDFSPLHPGTVLLEEFIKPLGLSQHQLAIRMRVSPQKINDIVRGKRGITPETAWLLAQALNTTPEFWVNLQAAHDLARSRPARSVARTGATRWPARPASQCSTSSPRRT